MIIFFATLLFAEPDYSQLPPPGPPISVPYPAATYYETPEGFPIWYYRDTRFPLVQLYVHFDAGTIHNEQPQALAIAAAGWKRGPRWRSQSWWSNRLAAIGGEPSLSMYQTAAVAELSVLKGHASAGLKLLRATLRSPNRADWQRLRKQAPVNKVLRIREQHFRLIRQLVYGKIDSLSQPTVYRMCQLSKAYQQWKRQARPTFVVVGDTDIQALLPQLNRFWSRRTDAAREEGARRKRIPWQGHKAILNMDASHQVAISLLIPYSGLNEKEWAALEQLNFILGGSFGSRLSSVVREKKGLSYAVGSRLHGHASFGFIEISLTAAIEDLVAVRDTISDVVLGLSTIEEEELQKVRSNSMKEKRTQLMSLQYVARNLIRFQSDGWKRRSTLSEQITRAELESLAKKIMQNKDKSWVLTGSATEITAALGEERWDVYDTELKIDTHFP